MTPDAVVQVAGWQGMTPLDAFVFVWSIIMLVPCFCRLDPLKYEQHKLLPVLFHQALACICPGCAFTAWYGDVGFIEIAALSAVALWLLWSYGTWRRGVPPYVERRLTQPLLRRASDAQARGPVL